MRERIIVTIFVLSFLSTYTSLANPLDITYAFPKDVDHHSVTIQWAFSNRNNYGNDTIESNDDSIRTRVRVENRFSISMRNILFYINQTVGTIDQLQSGRVYRVCVSVVAVESPDDDVDGQDELETLGNERCITVTTVLKLWNSYSKAALAMTIIIFLALLIIQVLDKIFPEELPDFMQEPDDADGDVIQLREKKRKKDERNQISRQSFDFDGIDVDDTRSSIADLEWMKGV